MFNKKKRQFLPDWKLKLIIIFIDKPFAVSHNETKFDKKVIRLSRRCQHDNVTISFDIRKVYGNYLCNNKVHILHNILYSKLCDEDWQKAIGSKNTSHLHLQVTKKNLHRAFNFLSKISECVKRTRTAEKDKSAFNKIKTIQYVCVTVMKCLLMMFT